jgi:LuxR family maltose regulon positive regulatory protein
LAAAARVFAQRGDTQSAMAAMSGTDRLRPQLTGAIPWLSVQTRLELARAHLALAEPGAARTLHNEARDILLHAGDLGTLTTQTADLGQLLQAAESSRGRWASSLTAAELRVLPFLTTHLTFREIGERLFVTQNTVKTQAISIYRKLGASNRGEAIQVAAELGLIDASASRGARTLAWSRKT